MKKKLLIAIDGPSSSGKGTIAKKIANHFNLPYLNTGALYRLTAYTAIQNKIDLSNIPQILPLIKDLDLTNLESLELHNEEIGAAASKVAQNQEIRQALFILQKDFANHQQGAVIEGRDIGTVICPDADYKFFITASAEKRARRRYKQFLEGNIKADYEDILSKLRERDSQDKNRQNSPLVKAQDAVLIDTSDMSVDQVFNKIINNIK